MDYIIIKNIGLILTVMSMWPVEKYLSKLKKQNRNHYLIAGSIIFVIYAVVGICLFVNIFMVKFPKNIQNMPFHQAIYELGLDDLEYELELPKEHEEYKYFDQTDYYVTAINSSGRTYIFKGSVVTLRITKISSSALMYDNLIEQINRLSNILDSRGNYTVADGAFLEDTDGNFISSQNESSTSDARQGETTVDDVQNEITSDGYTQESNIPNSSDVSMEITSVTVSDSFYYEYPSTTSGWTSVVDFGPGIHGTFKYSRPLTEDEYSDWGHSGNLFNSEFQLVGGPGNYGLFWASSDGRFAVQFPEGMEHGTYTYKLDTGFGDQWTTATISFVY